MHQITINRFHPHELDAPIKEHEERGWELVKRSATESEHKQYSYREDAKANKYKYKETEVHRKHTAVMRRVETSTLL